ncbi:MAG: hypothetical protein Fur0039_18690 [Rhodocyclaceae bacterium]
MRRRGGFSLLELAVAIALVTGLMYVLLDRIAWVQEMAEKTGMEESVRSIETGLRLEAASRLARGLATEDLERENPVRWLQAPPRNYLGELERAPASCPQGCWFYLRDAGSLAFRPGRAEHLEVAGGSREIRFAVAGPDARGAAWRMVPVRAYRWF